jgi:hypothetical protein
MDMNPYLAECLMKNNVSDGRRWAEQERLLGEVAQPGLRRWWQPALLALGAVLVLATTFLA